MKHIQVKALEEIAFLYKEHKYIGGNQNWFSEHTMAIGGCGPTAAANILAYFAMTRPHMTELFQGDMTYHNYLTHMTLIYDYVTPTELYVADKKDQVKHIFGRKIPPSLGLRNPNKMVKGVCRCAREKGVTLKAVKLNKPKSYQELKGFITDALESNYPIALRNMFQGVPMYFESPTTNQVREVNYQLHWVTIVGLIEGEETTIEVLTWGGLAKVDLEVFWTANEKNLIFPVRAVYFTE